VRQLFERHAAVSPAEASAARLDFFRSQLWPRLKEAAPRGLLLFVPHYFDYVRLRNFLRAEGAEFSELCEYTPQKEVRRGRLEGASWGWGVKGMGGGAGCQQTLPKEGMGWALG
jgi:U3 small nucleolar RNA-associated protein 25